MRQFLLALLMACILAFTSATPCIYKGSNGKTYNLALKEDIKVQGDRWTYLVRFCGVVAAPTECSTNKASICSLNGDYFNGYFGPWEATDGPTITDDGEALTIKYTNGEVASQPIPMTVTLTCGKVPSGKMLEESFTGFQMALAAPVGCPVGGDDDGLSGGAIFLIVLASVIPVYIIAGCIYNIKKNGIPFGLNACPQKNFWFSIPGLVKDGCVFTWQKLRGLCNKSGTTSSAGYEDNYGTMA